MSGPFTSQIQNRNYLSGIGFKFNLGKYPKVDFFSNSARIPELSLEVAKQPSYLKDIDVPGDKIQFGDLNIRFLVDEDLVNYMELQNWIRGLGYPESLKEFNDLESEAVGSMYEDGDNIYSDGTLQVLSSNLVAKFNVNFKDLFPVSLSTITFDATDTDIDYFTAEATFKYTIYNLTDLNNNSL